MAHGRHTGAGNVSPPPSRSPPINLEAAPGPNVHTNHSPPPHPPIMPLALREVLHDSEWNELIQCEHEAYLEPFNGVYRLFRPHQSRDARGRQGFKELRDRQLSWHQHDPTSRWFKVVDTDIGDKVVGGACWHTFAQNPYPEGKEHPMEATWWSEGKHALRGHRTGAG